MILATHGIIASQIQSFVGLLDTYPNAAAAYSVRKLRAAYSGSAIKVRRSSDNTEQDIGFSGENLDTTALTSFCSGTNGFVTTWYDQSGNGLNVTQSTAANQPQIVNSGSVININSKPSLKFDGTNDFLNGGNILQAGSNSMSTFSVANFNNTGLQTVYAKSQLGGNPNRYALIQSGTLTSLTSPGNATSASAYTGQKLFSVQIIANNTHKLFQNNNEVATSSYTTVGNSNFDFELGGYNDAFGVAANNLPLNGDLQEVVLYLSNQSSNRTAISTDINTYYGIY